MPGWNSESLVVFTVWELNRRNFQRRNRPVQFSALQTLQEKIGNTKARRNNLNFNVLKHSLDVKKKPPVMYVLGDMINGVQAYFVPIIKGNSFSERISWWLMSAIGARILQIYILFQRNPKGLPWFLPKRNPGGDSLRKTKQLKQIRHNGLPGTAPKNRTILTKKLSARTLLVWPDKNRLEMTRAALCGSI